MISLMCQKTDGGVINTDKVALQAIIENDDSSNKHFNNNNTNTNDTLNNNNNNLISNTNKTTINNNNSPTKFSFHESQNEKKTVDFNFDQQQQQQHQNSHSSSFLKRRPKSFNVTRTKSEFTFKDVPTTESLMCHKCKDPLSYPNDICSCLTSLRPSTASTTGNKRRISAKKLQQVQEWLNEQIIKRSQLQNTGEKYASLQHQFNCTLDNEYQLVQNVEENLNQASTEHLRKKEIIYKNWVVNVQEPIKKEVVKNAQSSSAFYAKVMRDVKYIEYLKQVNKYGCAFQDDFDTSEYNPLQKVEIAAKLNAKLKDSTNVFERKVHHEQRIIKNCIPLNARTAEKPPKPVEQRPHGLPNFTSDKQTRSDISWSKWLEEKYNAVESTIRIKSSNKCNPDRNNSRVSFNWNYGNNVYHIPPNKFMAYKMDRQKSDFIKHTPSPDKHRTISNLSAATLIESSAT